MTLKAYPNPPFLQLLLSALLQMPQEPENSTPQLPADVSAGPCAVTNFIAEPHAAAAAAAGRWMRPEQQIQAPT